MTALIYNSLPPMRNFPDEGKPRRSRGWWIAFWFLIGMMAGRCFGQSPASELQAALIDCQSLSPTQRASARYLSLYAIAPEDREEAAKVLSFAVNSLSRTRAITGPTPVTDTLVRIDFLKYAPSGSEFKEWHNAWEKLGESEPTWHLKTEVIDHIKLEKNKFKTTTRIATVDGGWVGLQNAQALKLLTASNAPILRADYFITVALQSPHYYNFAGISIDENKFLDSIGVDSATIDKLRANAGANMILSGVTFKSRRIVWSQGPLGGVYETLDVLSVDAARDPIRRAITAQGLVLRYDVSEWYTMGANGLWKVALYNEAGKRQDTVPDKVAKDTSDPQGDGIVIPLTSCVRCHVEEGLRPFVDDQTRLLAKSVLKSYDPNLILRAQEFYDEPRLKRQMKFDRETYTAACKTACEMTPHEVAEALGKVVRNYSYLPVTLNQAARECGVDAKEFRAAIVNLADPYLLSLLEQTPILRGQWDASFNAAIVSIESRRRP